METAPPTVIVGNRWKAARILLMSLGFVAVGSFAVVVQGQTFLLVPATLFFGGTAALALWLTIIPPKLILTDDVIEHRSIRSWRMTWDEIGGTRLRSTGRTSFVEVAYAEGAETRNRSGLPHARTVSSYLWMSPAEVRTLYRIAWRPCGLLRRARNPGSTRCP